MNKRDYFLQALHAGLGKKRFWVNRVFSETDDPPNTPPYPFQLVHQDGGVYFRDPTQLDTLVRIDDAPTRGPLLRFREPFELQPNELANYTGTTPLTTTYGNVFVNHLILVLPFGDIIPFQDGYVEISKIEKMIEARLVDDPEDDDGVSPPPPGKIYVRQYLQFCDYVLSLVAYTPLAVMATSEKALTFHPDARKRRQELIDQYKDRLNDPAVVAKIGDELVKLDKEWLADDPTIDFYNVNPGKLFNAVRKKLYYLFGGESPFQDGTSVEFIKPSLQEGIDPKHFPTMINSLRFGSYNRGAQTKLGGESTKTIYRMLGTVTVSEEDCKTPLGVPLVLTPNNYKRYVGFWVRDQGNEFLLTEDLAQGVFGKPLELRTPMTCKTEGRNVCQRCIGESLAQQPNALAAAAAQVGGTFLSTFLALFHGTSLKTKKWDFREGLS